MDRDCDTLLKKKDPSSHAGVYGQDNLTQEALDQKSIFLAFSRKLQQLINKKYQQLLMSLRDKNGDTFFSDTTDSVTIQDLL